MRGCITLGEEDEGDRCRCLLPCAGVKRTVEEGVLFCVEVKRTGEEGVLPCAGVKQTDVDVYYLVQE